VTTGNALAGKAKLAIEQASAHINQTTQERAASPAVGAWWLIKSVLRRPVWLKMPADEFR
jgi:hypothetical protein